MKVASLFLISLILHRMKWITKIFIVAACCVLMAHNFVAHHHHTQRHELEVEHHHDDDDSDHNIFSFEDLDGSYLTSQSFHGISKISSFVMYLLPENSVVIRSNYSEPFDAVVSQCPRPEPVSRSFSRRGPPVL